MFRTVSGGRYAAVTDFRVSASGTGEQEDLVLTALPGQGFVAIWYNNAFGNGSLIGQIFDLNGRKVGAEFAIGNSGASQASVTALTGGNFVVTWSTEAPFPSVFDIHGQLFNSSGGSVGSEFVVNTRTQGFQTDSIVTPLAGGGFVVAWQQPEDSTFDHVRAQVFAADGSKIGGEIIATDAQPGDKYAPIAAVGLVGGGFVIGWTEGAAADTRAQLFDAAGNKLGSAFLLNTITDGYQLNPTLAALPGGGFVAAWSDDGNRNGVSPHPENQGVWVQIFDSTGAKVGAASRVGSFEPDRPEIPTIAVSANGFLVTWRDGTFSSDGTPYNLRSQGFDLNGNKVGEEFAVNPGSTATQNIPAEIALSNGAFVIGWSNTQPPLFEEDVRARILFPVSYGTEAADTLVGTANRDFFIGLGGDDSISGGAEDDGLAGSGGNDFLDGGTGADTMDGGTGNDVYVVDNINDVVTELADEGTDEVRTDLQIYTLRTNFENLVGTADFGQQLAGNALNNRIDGGGGFDVIIGNAGDDTLAGHGGSDLYIIDSAGDIVIEQANEGTDEVRTALASWTLGANIEILSGTATTGQTLTGNDLANLIIGAAGNDTIIGGIGNDTIDGKGGNDILDGGTGNDSMSGGTGDDIYYVDNALDFVSEFNGGGNDEIRSTAASYTLNAQFIETLRGMLDTGQVLIGGNTIIAGAGNDTLDGSQTMIGGLGDDLYYVRLVSASVLEAAGEGIDTIYLVPQDNGFTFTLPSNVERLVGHPTSSQTLIGNALDNDIVGGDGTDTIDGGIGADTMHGGAGNDTYYVDNVGDVVDEAGAGGRDFVYTALASYTLGTDVEVLMGTSSTGQVLSGNGQANEIYAGSGDDFITGGAGIDRFGGGDGIDTLSYAGNSGLVRLNIEIGFLGRVSENDDGNYLETFSGIEIVEGSAFNDVFWNQTDVSITFRGLGGNDTLTGGFAADILDGGTGADTLYGGYGSDLYFVDDSGDQVTEELNAGTADEVRTALASYALTANVELLTGTGLVDQNLTGNASDNIINGGAGADTMTGGLGNDIYYVDSFGDVVVENGGEGIDEIRTSLNGFNLLTTPNVERLVATTNDAHGFRGNGADNFIGGAGGNDSLFLQDGGNDSVDAGAGDDIIYFGGALNAPDAVNGGAGARDVLVLQGNYTLALANTTMGGIEFLSLQSGSITRFGDLAGNLYDYNLTLADGNVGAGVQLVVNAQSLLAGEDLTFDGSAELDGRFLVYGGHGVDTLKGGAGNDIFFFEGARFGGSDSVDGGGGRDSLVIAGQNGLNHIEFGNSALTSIESISVNNRFATDPSAVPIYELVLHDGNVAADAVMTVNASSLGASQTVNVDAHLELDGAFNMFGGGGADTFIGGGKGDLIYAAGGADTLTGGGGGDTFQYRSTGDSMAASLDRILDFTSGSDRIDLSFIDADTSAAGDQAFHWIGSNAFTGSGAASAGELRAYESNGSWFLEGDVNGDGAADLAIQLVGAAPIGQADFIL